MIAAIVAVDNNFGIGSNNELLTNIPEDLKNFKRLTTNNVVIMGRKTYDSLPVKPLPNRTNIVITSNLDLLNSNDISKNNVIFVTLDFIKTLFKSISPNNLLVDIFIIGGGIIYKELLHYCEQIYMTKINHTYNNADTYFPNIDCMQDWKLTMSSDTRKYNDIEYKFCIYKRGEIK